MVISLYLLMLFTLNSVCVFCFFLQALADTSSGCCDVCEDSHGQYLRLVGFAMLPGVGVFGTGSTARVLVPLLKAEGFEVHALWGQSEDEACCLASELGIPYHTSRSDDVLLHPDVNLVCIYIPPSMTRQIAVKALGKLCYVHTFGKKL